jgi:DNA polymerase-3 subunit epsilon
MPMILVFDTETTGLPDYHKPSEMPHQPHLVELAAILFDTDTMKVVDDLDTLVQPDGWVSEPEAFAAHGITEAEAMRDGLPERVALSLFLDLMDMADYRVAFNEAGFDQRIIRIAIKRYGDGSSDPRNSQVEHRDAIADAFKECKGYCVMYGSRRERPNVFKRKVPNLAEALQFWCGKEIEGAHRAMVDADACLDIYLAMLAAGCAVDPR